MAKARRIRKEQAGSDRESTAESESDSEAGEQRFPVHATGDQGPTATLAAFLGEAFEEARTVAGPRFQRVLWSKALDEEGNPVVPGCMFEATFGYTVPGKRSRRCRKEVVLAMADTGASYTYVAAAEVRSRKCFASLQSVLDSPPSGSATCANGGTVTVYPPRELDMQAGGITFVGGKFRVYEGGSIPLLWGRDAMQAYQARTTLHPTKGYPHGCIQPEGFGCIPLLPPRPRIAKEEGAREALIAALLAFEEAEQVPESQATWHNVEQPVPQKAEHRAPQEAERRAPQVPLEADHRVPLEADHRVPLEADHRAPQPSLRVAQARAAARANADCLAYEKVGGRRTKLRLATSVTVGPGPGVTVMAELLPEEDPSAPSESAGLVQPLPGFELGELQDGHLVTWALGASLVRWRPNTTVFAPILNASATPITLQVGTVVGEIIEFDVPGLEELEAWSDTLRAELRIRTSHTIPPPPPPVPRGEPGAGAPEEFTEEDIRAKAKLGRSLSDPQREALRKMLVDRRQQFPTDPKRPGQTYLEELILDTGTAAPVRSVDRRYSPAEAKMIEDEIRLLLDRDIIEPSASAWKAGLVCVAKKDGSLRMCVDFRGLNAVLRGDAGGLGRIDTNLDSLHGARYFTVLDLASGYFQIPVHLDSRHKTAFAAPNGRLYQYKVAPFGIKTLPTLFTRTVMAAVGAALGKFAVIWLDDILVYSRTFDEHVRQVAEILDRLQHAQLKVNLSKCEFGCDQVTYLGHLVNRDGVSPDPAKIRAITGMARPTTLGGLSTLLGMFSYHRQFIKGFAELAQPLYDLIGRLGGHQRRSQSTKQIGSDTWTAACDTAVANLKAAITRAPILAHPNFSREFMVITDASSKGVGAVLAQHNAEEHLTVIQYASRKLSKVQAAYSATERECLAILWATQLFRPYVFGAKFTLVTDARALLWLFKIRDSSQKLLRWSLRLQEHDMTVLHAPGTTMGLADAPSRLLQEGEQGAPGIDIEEHWPDDPAPEMDTGRLLDSGGRYSVPELEVASLSLGDVPLPASVQGTRAVGTGKKKKKTEVDPEGQDPTQAARTLEQVTEQARLEREALEKVESPQEEGLMAVLQDSRPEELITHYDACCGVGGAHLAAKGLLLTRGGCDVNRHVTQAYQAMHGLQPMNAGVGDAGVHQEVKDLGRENLITISAPCSPFSSEGLRIERPELVEPTVQACELLAQSPSRLGVLESVIPFLKSATWARCREILGKAGFLIAPTKVRGERVPRQPSVPKFSTKRARTFVIMARPDGPSEEAKLRTMGQLLAAAREVDLMQRQQRHEPAKLWEVIGASPSDCYFSVERHRQRPQILSCDTVPGALIPRHARPKPLQEPAGRPGDMICDFQNVIELGPQGVLQANGFGKKAAKLDRKMPRTQAEKAAGSVIVPGMLRLVLEAMKYQQLLRRRPAALKVRPKELPTMMVSLLQDSPKLEAPPAELARLWAMVLQDDEEQHDEEPRDGGPNPEERAKDFSEPQSKAVLAGIPSGYMVQALPPMEMSPTALLHRIALTRFGDDWYHGEIVAHNPSAHPQEPYEIRYPKQRAQKVVETWHQGLKLEEYDGMGGTSTWTLLTQVDPEVEPTIKAYATGWNRRREATGRPRVPPTSTTSQEKLPATNIQDRKKRGPSTRAPARDEDEVGCSPASAQLRSAVTRKELRATQQRDARTGALIHYMKDGVLPRNDEQRQEVEAGVRSCSLTQDGVLVRHAGVGRANDHGLRIEVPQELVTRIIYANHNLASMAHRGVQHTQARVAAHFTWPSLAKDVADYVRACSCSGRKAIFYKERSRLRAVHALQPWSLAVMDTMGMKAKSKEGNTHLLVVQDYATKYVWTFPTKGETAQELVPHLYKLFLQEGSPVEMHSDSGPAFVGELNRGMCELARIRKSEITPASHQARDKSNGPTEHSKKPSVSFPGPRIRSGTVTWGR